MFYASLVSDHPTAVVPMTNYGHVMENTRDVLALHTISQGLLNINYSEFGVSGKDRSWHKILPTGVEAFRKRIELLAKSGKVVPTFRSLRELASQTGSTLEIDTRYGHRCWSISALFVDEPQPDRRGMKAESWALKRIEELATDRSNDDEDTSVGTAILHDWARALDLARDLWTKYTNRELMKMRQRVSRIAWQLQAGERTADSLSNEDNDALSHFGVVSSSLVSTSECRSEDCVDILSGDYSTRQRRWAALIIVVRVIHRRWEACGRIQDSIATLTEEETDREERDHYQQMLARAKRLVNDEDIYLALFPIPTKPLILPWDRKPPPTISSQPRFKEVARKMRLSIENVLKSRLHHADAMDEEGSGGFGMDLGELRVMRSYASEWYLEQSSKKKTGLRDWVADDQMKEVLLWDDPSIVREFVHE